VKLNFEQSIDASLETVWAAFNNSSNKERWQQNFESYKRTTGDPGQPGAVSELAFNENGKLMIVPLRNVVSRIFCPPVMNQNMPQQ